MVFPFLYWLPHLDRMFNCHAWWNRMAVTSSSTGIEGTVVLLGETDKAEMSRLSHRQVDLRKGNSLVRFFPHFDQILVTYKILWEKSVHFGSYPDPIPITSVTSNSSIRCWLHIYVYICMYMYMSINIYIYICLYNPLLYNYVMYIYILCTQWFYFMCIYPIPWLKHLKLKPPSAIGHQLIGTAWVPKSDTYGCSSTPKYGMIIYEIYIRYFIYNTYIICHILYKVYIYIYYNNILYTIY